MRAYGKFSFLFSQIPPTMWKFLVITTLLMDVTRYRVSALHMSYAPQYVSAICNKLKLFAQNIAKAPLIDLGVDHN